MPDTESDTDRAVAAKTADSRPVAKFLIDLAPLIVFFAAYKTQGSIQVATAAIIAATLLSLLASWLLFKKIAVMPLVTAAIVSIFGGVSLWFANPIIFYYKPTIINLIFALVLMFGLATGRPLIKTLFDGQLHLTDEGWHKLTVRWIGFFISMAALNEFVWRNFAETTWVNFKVFGILTLTFVFMIAQLGLIKRHEPPSEP